MPKIVRGATPITGEVSSSGLQFRLPPALIDRAAQRLCWISLVCATTTVLMFLVHGWLQPEVRAMRAADPTLPLLALAMVLVSSGMVAVQRYRLLSSWAILNTGLVFEVFVAFAISLFETALPLPKDHYVLGVSMVAVWITVCGLLIPNAPLMTAVVGLLSAAMWPAAYYLNVHLHGYEALPASRLGVFHFVNFSMAFWAYFLNKRIYALEMSAHRAQEMGSYDLIALLGRGGMGEVWRARHKMLARDSAIKVIRPEVLMAQPGRQADMVRRRFEREARATANLRSPHTVDLYDFGASQDGSFYFVMELLDGVNLQVLVDKFGPQPAKRVVFLLRQICDSLEEAHRASLIHRDIKPSNIYLCAQGLQFDYIKVLDFGLVKSTSSPELSQMTMEGQAAGTPAYMAPEASLGEQRIDGRSDLYSVGCVAYYLLTGRLLFEEATATATALAHVQKVVVPPSARTEMPVPGDLEELVLACLAKKPEDRPHSAQELSRRLAALQCSGEWGRDEAAAWWQRNLPVTSAERVATQRESAGTIVTSASGM
ncbi:MAG: serine/threonine protein kinase [Bryobacterales bacterium]|nr:serine/threonine protein kinase [Bryobacterales bacterium]